MKTRLVIFTACLFIVFCSQAQVLTSKKGLPILPQKGDFAIGASAAPFLDFIGNITKINSTAVFSSPASMSFLEPSKMYIYGKYFLDDKTAIRGKFRFASTSKTSSNFVTKNGGVSGVDMVEDKWTNSTTNILVSAGLEKRRGYGRLQGYYGAEAMLSLMGGLKDTYTYGNEINTTYKTPTRTNFNSNVFGGSTYDTNNSTEAVFGIGLNCFVGVEYFFAPKISIGGEFGWGVGINQAASSAGKSQSTYQYWDSAKSSVQSKTDIISGGTSNIGFDTRSTGGQIFVLFHF